MNSENKGIRLEKVNTGNFDDLIRLTPDEEGKNYVASNIYSLAEAYANLSAGRYAQPFGIYNGETPVGFLMIGYDIVDEDDDPEKQYYIRNSYLIWRLMIDREHLHKGYGKAAMKLALDFIRTFPCGPADYCWTSDEPENEVACRLYKSFGFSETGEKDVEELIAVLPLK